MVGSCPGWGSDTRGDCDEKVMITFVCHKVMVVTNLTTLTSGGRHQMKNRGSMIDANPRHQLGLMPDGCDITVKDQGQRVGFYYLYARLRLAVCH